MQKIKEKFDEFVKNNFVLVFFATSLFLKTLLLDFEINNPNSFADLRQVFVAAGFIIILLLPALFFKKIQKHYSILLNAFFSFVFIMDLIYYRFFGAIPSLGLLSAAGQVDSVIGDLPHLIRPWDVFMFLDFAAFYYLYKKIWPKLKPKATSLNTKLIIGVTGVLMAVLGIVAISGDFLPSVTTTVSNNKIVVRQYSVFGAHFFDIYREMAGLTNRLSKKERGQIIADAKKNSTKLTPNSLTGVAKGKNIIMIQVESLQNFVIGKKIDGQEITPNLNKLAAHSHDFQNHYFEIGGGNTSDVDFNANTSIYPLENSAVFIRYGNKNFTSLPKELEKLGYSAYAYHANNRGFWNRATAFKSLGYQKYFAEENYPKGETIDLGLNDEAYLDKTVDYLKNQPKPAFSYLITLSNHYPFEMAADKSKLKITDDISKSSSSYLKSVNYSDYCLGNFFDQLKENNLYDDSVIVLYGDHKAHFDSFKANGIEFDGSKTEDENVPFMIKLPGQTKKVNHPEVSSHIDIMPTVLNLVGADTTAPMFGRDLFSNAKPFFASLYYFDPVLIMDGNLRYKQLSNNTETCEIKKGDSYERTKLSDCNTLKSKKRTKIDLSRNLILYNLFKFF